ncbi:MAG: signal recognition particle protein [Clostridia bacterium]|nr:signal recognition particle protein [Clostridia bacterium]
MALFENLGSRLQEAFRKLRRKGKLSEADVNEAMREIRLALLEADVNFKVVKDFVAQVSQRAVGEEVMASLTPGQQVIKIVYEELTSLMGGGAKRLNYAPSPPTVIALVGLQGSGKTTSAAKLALHLKKEGRKPLLVAADVYRPAAIRQLEILGQQIGVPVFSLGGQNPRDIALASVAHAKRGGLDVVVIDTAGRLHIDEELMAELEEIRSVSHPNEILLVVDATTGQDAVKVATSFNQRLGLTGVILTKLDGDARGGAALSVTAVTGCPIKFAGMGEKLEALEYFHPDRMASRILGMGDVLTLIEKAQEAFNEERAKELERKILREQFTLEDFLEQLQQVKSMGPVSELVNLIPGLKLKGADKLVVDERELKRIEAIVQSMTVQERRNPAIINGSRKKRIARGSGTQVSDVNRLLKQFEQAQRLARQLGGMVGKKGKVRPGLGSLFSFK